MSMFEIIHRQQKRSAMIDRFQNIKGFPSQTTDVSPSSSDNRTIEYALQHIKGSPYFIWCQLHALADNMATLNLEHVSQPTPALEVFTNPVSASSSTSSSPTTASVSAPTTSSVQARTIPESIVLQDSLKRLDQQIQTLYTALPSNSMMMIISNQDEEKKETFQRFLSPSSQNWTILHHNALTDFIHQKRRTRSFFQIKP